MYGFKLKVTGLIHKLIRDDSGATAIEYGLIAALISIAIIAGATIAGSQVAAAFNSVATALQGAIN